MTTTFEIKPEDVLNLEAENEKLRDKIASWIDMTVNCAGVPQNPDSLIQMLLYEFRAALSTQEGGASCQPTSTPS